MKENFNSINDMISSDSYRNFIDGKLGSDLFISEPDRAERIYEYSKLGLNGSTYNEEIEDYKEYLEKLKVFNPEEDCYCEEGDTCNCSIKFNISQEQYDNVTREISELETFYSDKLENIIGD